MQVTIHLTSNNVRAVLYLVYCLCHLPVFACLQTKFHLLPGDVNSWGTSWGHFIVIVLQLLWWCNEKWVVCTNLHHTKKIGAGVGPSTRACPSVLSWVQVRFKIVFSESSFFHKQKTNCWRVRTLLQSEGACSPRFNDPRNINCSTNLFFFCVQASSIYSLLCLQFLKHWV